VLYRKAKKGDIAPVGYQPNRFSSSSFGAYHMKEGFAARPMFSLMT